MKPFLIYTAMRFGLFLGLWFVIYGIAALLWGPLTPGPVLLTIIVAAIGSSVLSVTVLKAQRERFAEAISARADRAHARFEEMRAKEDYDEPLGEPVDRSDDEPGSA